MATTRRKVRAESAGGAQSAVAPPEAKLAATVAPAQALPPAARDTDEVGVLRRQVSDLSNEVAFHNEITTGFAEQNWDFLRDRAEALRNSIDTQLETLSNDIAGLCAFSRTQKQLISQRIRDKKSRSGTEKVFRWRDSTLSVMFRTTREFSTVYNIFVAILVLFTVKTLLAEYWDSQGLFSMSMLRWNFGGMDVVIPTWMVMFATHSLLLPLMWIWRSGYLGDTLYLLLYSLHQAAFFFVFGVWIGKLGLPIASNMILLCEQVRMCMKGHSFVRETLKIKGIAREETAPAAAASPAQDQEMARANRTLLPTFSQQFYAFFLFHFVPTLLYRNQYPRLPKVRWSRFVIHLMEVAACIFYTYTVFALFCIPEFQKTAAEPGDLKQLVMSIFDSLLPSILVYVLAFFAILHCWFNAFAEITRFADRLFYEDWWNTTDFALYYRKWNIVVGDWLFNYFFVEMSRSGYGRTACMLWTFIFSAIIHEYIIAIAMGFFYPVMLVLFLGFGVPFVWLTRLFTGPRFWNVMFWINMIIGNGLLMVLYSREYYAQQGPKAGLDTASWWPLSWQPFLK